MCANTKKWWRWTGIAIAKLKSRDLSCDEYEAFLAQREYLRRLAGRSLGFGGTWCHCDHLQSEVTLPAIDMLQQKVAEAQVSHSFIGGDEKSCDWVKAQFLDLGPMKNAPLDRAPPG